MFKSEKKLITTQLQESPNYTNNPQPSVKRKLVFEQHSINDIASNALFLNNIFKYLFYIYEYYLLS